MCRKADWREVLAGEWYGIVRRDEQPLDFRVHQIIYATCIGASGYALLVY